MASRTAHANAGKEDPSQSMLLAPALAFNTWNPFLVGALRGNAEIREGFGTIAREWEAFMGCRLKEDFALMQRLTRSSGAPDQILAAYTDFWQKAAEDYGREITTMSKLMAGLATQTLSAAQSATEEASAKVLPSREAGKETL
jgi:hypothetical protein